MNDQNTVLEALASTVRDARLHKKNDQVPPAAILWPDSERQWECLQRDLVECLPLFTLGAYHPEARMGPVYWLRCVIAGTLPEYRLPSGVTPVIYLPGLSKENLRPSEEMPRLLQPLAELYYRGVWWTRKNGRDWTPSTFLRTASQGLGIELRRDSATQAALHRALPKLVHEPLAHLKQATPLSASFFDAL